MHSYHRRLSWIFPPAIYQQTRLRQLQRWIEPPQETFAILVYQTVELIPLRRQAILELNAAPAPAFEFRFRIRREIVAEQPIPACSGYLREG
jgi:hypothetical protein